MIKEDYGMAAKVVAKIHMFSDEQMSNDHGNRREIESFIADQMDWIAPNKDANSYMSLLLPRYRRAFLVGIMLCVIQQATGINLVIFYSRKVLLYYPK